jgi:hypothetical protein
VDEKGGRTEGGWKRGADRRWMKRGADMSHWWIDLIGTFFMKISEFGF